MAQRLMLSPRTIESRLLSALTKTGCLSRLELLLWSLSPSIDLVEPDNSSDSLY